MRIKLEKNSMKLKQQENDNKSNIKIIINI